MCGTVGYVGAREATPILLDGLGRLEFPLQLLAYHIAVLCGCDVDRLRNLAKCAMVE